MTSVLLEPYTRGADGVGLSTLRDFSKVAAAGYQWVSLYLGGTYGVKPYAIEAAWAAGLPVMLNYERLASDAKNGYPAGQRAAQTALGQAQALGFLGEAPLPFSAADEHFADMAGAGLDYHRALVDVLQPEGWVGGAYGFREMLALIAQQPWWPDGWPLWHWGGDGSTVYPWTWVKQGPGGSYYDSTIGMQVDRNTLYKPMKFWSGYGPDNKVDPPEETVTEDDMRTIAKYVWEYLIHNDQDQTDQTAEAMFGWAHLESYNGSFDRTAVNMVDQVEQPLGDLIRYAHYEAHTANVKCDQILNVLTTLPSGGVTADAIVDELVRRLSQGHST